jgi:hypothetical protein
MENYELDCITRSKWKARGKKLNRASQFYHDKLKHSRFSVEAVIMTNDLEDENGMVDEEKRTALEETSSSILPMRSSSNYEDDEFAPHSTDDASEADSIGRESNNTSEIISRTDFVQKTEREDLYVEGIKDERAVYENEEKHFDVASFPERPIVDYNGGSGECGFFLDKSHPKLSPQNDYGDALPIIPGELRVLGSNIKDLLDVDSSLAMTLTKMQERFKSNPLSTTESEAHVVDIAQDDGEGDNPIDWSEAQVVSSNEEGDGGHANDGDKAVKSAFSFDGLTLDSTQSSSLSIDVGSSNEREKDTSDHLHVLGAGEAIVEFAQDDGECDRLTVWSEAQMALHNETSDRGQAYDIDKVVQSAFSFDGLTLDPTQSISYSINAGSKDESEGDTSDDLYALATVWVEGAIIEERIVRASAHKSTPSCRLILDPTHSLSSSSGEGSKDENEQDTSSASLFRNITIDSDSTEQLVSFDSEECINESKHDSSRVSCLSKQKVKFNSHEVVLELALKKSRAETDALRAEINAMRAENDALRADNEALQLDAGNRKFSFYKPSAVDELIELRNCRAENDVLRAQVSELMRLNDTPSASSSAGSSWGSSGMSSERSSVGSSAGMSAGSSVVSWSSRDLSIESSAGLSQENARLRAEARHDKKRIQKLTHEIQILKHAASAVVIAARSCRSKVDRVAAAGVSVKSVGSLGSSVSPVKSNRLLAFSSSKSSDDSSLKLKLGLPLVSSEESSILRGLAMLSSETGSVKELKESSTLTNAYPQQKVEAFWRDMFLIGVPSIGTSYEEGSVGSLASAAESRMGMSLGSRVQLSVASSVGSH